MTENTTPQADDRVRAELSQPWSPTRGQARLYVQNLPDIIGLEVERYRTGAVRSAWLDGSKVSNARATALLQVRVWIGDHDGSVHVDRNNGALLTDGQIVELVQDAR